MSTRASQVLACLGAALAVCAFAVPIPAQAAPAAQNVWDIVTVADATPGITASLARPVPATSSAEAAYAVLVETTSAAAMATGVTVTLEVTTRPFDSADDLSNFEANPARFASQEIAEAPISGLVPGQLTPGTPVLTAVTIPAGGWALDPAAPGVYGVTVSVWSGAELSWSVGVPMTWQAASLAPVDVAVAATLSGSPERVAALAQATSDKRVSLLIDPASVSPAAVVTEGRRNAFSLAAGNLDISGVAHSGVGRVLPEAVTRSTGSSALPWIAVLTSLDKASVDAAALYGASFAIAAPGATGTDVLADGEVVLTDTATSQDFPVLMAHPELSAALDRASSADNASTARLVAQAAFASQAGLDAVLVTPGPAWQLEQDQNVPALSVLWAAPFVKPVNVQSLANRASERVALPDLSQSAHDPLTGEITSIATQLEKLDVLEGAVASPSALIQQLRDQLLGSLSVDNAVDSEVRAAAVRSALDSSQAAIGSVRVTSGSEVLLISQSGEVPITVSNGLDVPVDVIVEMTSRSAILRVRDVPTLTIPAGGEATALIPVEAVSSGDVSVSLAIVTPRGDTLSFAERINLSVRAAWGTTATWLFTAGLMVLLVGGVVRTARRGRKDTRFGPAAESDVAGAQKSDV